MAKPLLIGNYLNNDSRPDLMPKNLAVFKFWSVFDAMMMQRALILAKTGAKLGEVPVGAVITHQNQIIGQGYNRPISDHDPSSHAEVVAIRQACQYLHNYRLPNNSTLYVTLEPCTMCLGLLVHARVSRVVFATTEPKAGAVISQETFADKSYFNHKITIESGLYSQESAKLLSAFFKQRRLAKKNMR